MSKLNLLKKFKIKWTVVCRILLKLKINSGTNIIPKVQINSGGPGPSKRHKNNVTN